MIGRRTAQEANWGIFLALCLALFAIVNYLSFRHYARWDATASGAFTLSDATKKVVKDLKSPLKVVVFLPPGDELFSKVKDLLSAYQAASPLVQVEYIDPDRDRARVETLAKKYKVQVANVVVFDAGENSRYIEKDQMVDYDFSAMQMGGPPKVKAFKAEEAFTNALLDVLDPKKPVIYFSSGHGERGTQPREGTGIFRDRLSKEGAQLREWESLGKPEVPPDCDLLVIAGPEKPFLPQEAQAVGRYLSGGGKALLMLDPEFAEGAKAFTATGLEDLLKPWGLTLGQDIVIDPKGAVPYLGAQTFFASNFSQNPIVRDLAKNKLPALFTLAQSLGVEGGSDADYRAEALIRTTSEAWGEKDLAHLEDVKKDPTDTAGPLTVSTAVWSDNAGKRTRLVVAGDSDWASDALIQVGGGNLMLALNSVHWLLSQENRLAIPAKTSVETHLNLTGSQANVLFVLFVLGLPALAAGAGVYVYLRRRR
jgi:ABC-type uncharacterized transport system involved in gliding motility auxiliary subunit